MSVVLYFQVEKCNAANVGWGHLARIFLPEDPLLYALLAGLRATEWPGPPLHFIPPRGLPEDVKESTISEDCLTVDDEAAGLEVPSTCSRAEAEEYVKSGLSRYLHNRYSVTHFDFHSHSWLELDELIAVLSRYKDAGGYGEPELRAVIAMMRSLSETGSTTRAVFWFK